MTCAKKTVVRKSLISGCRVNREICLVVGGYDWFCACLGPRQILCACVCLLWIKRLFARELL